MRSQAGGTDPPPERPKRNRFFEWLRVACNICCCKVGLFGVSISIYKLFRPLVLIDFIVKWREFTFSLFFLLMRDNANQLAASDTAPSDIGAVNERKQFRI